MKGQQQVLAVLMGDLVRSESAKSIEHLHDRFNAAIGHSNVEHKKKLASPLTITLGDEFQGLARSLSDAATIARDLRFQLMSDAIDCRFVIGRVELQTPLNTKRAWNMMGPGLAETRKKLNEKRLTSLYRFAVEDELGIEPLLDALGAGLTSIERRWTDQQRQDIIALLKGASAAKLAQQRNVSVHSIYKVRGSGDFDTYVVQWHALQEALKRLDRVYGMVL